MINTQTSSLAAHYPVLLPTLSVLYFYTTGNAVVSLHLCHHKHVTNVCKIRMTTVFVSDRNFSAPLQSYGTTIMYMFNR